MTDRLADTEDLRRYPAERPIAPQDSPKMAGTDVLMARINLAIGRVVGQVNEDGRDALHTILDCVEKLCDAYEQVGTLQYRNGDLFDVIVGEMTEADMADNLHLRADLSEG